jgi:Family of unknown function (DUF6518)
MWIAAAGATAPDARGGAARGALTLSVANLGYYGLILATESTDPSAVAGAPSLWLILGLTGGAVFGAAGTIWRTGLPAARTAAALLCSAVLIADGGSGLRGAPVTDAISVIAGATLAFASASTPRLRLVASVGCAPASRRSRGPKSAGPSTTAGRSANSARQPSAPLPMPAPLPRAKFRYGPSSVSVRVTTRRADRSRFKPSPATPDVSRQWLYQQPELRNEIERLRDHNITDARPHVPDAQRASADSLRQRLENLRGENRRLREEVARAQGRAGDRLWPTARPTLTNRAIPTHGTISQEPVRIAAHSATGGGGAAAFTGAAGSRNVLAPVLAAGLIEIDDDADDRRYRQLMGLIFLGLCVAAAVINDGTAQTVAIVVAVLNGLSMVGQMGEAARGEPAGATTTLNMLTALAGVGLLIYGIAA